jgi:hypothetical protein
MRTPHVKTCKEPDATGRSVGASWGQFFVKFDEKGLTMLYQDKTNGNVAFSSL